VSTYDSDPSLNRTTSSSHYQSAAGAPVIAGDQAHAVFGQVMGLVALAVGCAALGAYIGRSLTGGTGIACFIAAFACVFGLNFASAKGHEQLAVAFMAGLGLLLGLAVAPVLAVYARSEPSVLWQAAGTTAAFVAALGALGYATRRDLSSWARSLFWALLALIALAITLIFVAIPAGHIIYAVVGLVVFGAFTIFDFNRLRLASRASAVPIAASIFLDIFNIFLLLLQLFGGERE
jgi:FtsH-binding integral membrane protein